MKIVINACYGGFSLSPLGVSEYLKRRGKAAYFYQKSKYSHIEGIKEYTKVEMPENALCFHTIVADLGDSAEKLPNALYFSCRNIPRDDSDLVAIVEQLGDQANGMCAQLKIVDVPDGVEWEIDEYDGFEHVEEQHRKWG